MASVGAAGRAVSDVGTGTPYLADQPLHRRLQNRLATIQELGEGNIGEINEVRFDMSRGRVHDAGSFRAAGRHWIIQWRMHRDVGGRTR
jgi:hypothetical protein